MEGPVKGLLLREWEELKGSDGQEEVNMSIVKKRRKQSRRRLRRRRRLGGARGNGGANGRRRWLG
jgi:hypothetical protein